MSVTRILQLAFKSGTSSDAINELLGRIYGMQTNCILADSSKPYIKLIRGGADISLEGLQRGMTHAFIIEFENTEDRDYYALKDPTHQAIIAALQEVIEKVQIVDIST